MLASDDLGKRINRSGHLGWQIFVRLEFKFRLVEPTSLNLCTFHCSVIILLDDTNSWPINSSACVHACRIYNSISHCSATIVHCVYWTIGNKCNLLRDKKYSQIIHWPAVIVFYLWFSQFTWTPYWQRTTKLVLILALLLLLLQKSIYGGTVQYMTDHQVATVIRNKKKQL